MSTTDPEIAHLRGQTMFRRVLLAFIGSVIFVGCASVPQESVELSTLVGKDVNALKQSYDRLIVEMYAGYRAERMAYLEYEWKPAFIEGFVKKGRLVDVAKGRVVFDESQKKFVDPTPGKEQQQLLSTIIMWSESAIRRIEKKRNELIDPLDADERRIRAEAAAAFDRVIQANATVTAHLSSIRDVKDYQNRVLEEVGAKDVVEDLNKTLIEISKEAKKSREELDKTGEFIDDAAEIRDEIRDNM